MRVKFEKKGQERILWMHRLNRRCNFDKQGVFIIGSDRCFCLRTILQSSRTENGNSKGQIIRESASSFSGSRKFLQIFIFSENEPAYKKNERIQNCEPDHCFLEIIACICRSEIKVFIEKPKQ